MEEPTTRQERRRRVKRKIENENGNSPERATKVQSVGKLVRSNTFTLIRAASSTNVPSLTAEANDTEGESSGSESVDEKKQESRKPPPIPAPRKLRLPALDLDKLSSDTDRDITEIDLDDGQLKSERDKSSRATPIPKPRKTEIYSPATADQGSFKSKAPNSSTPKSEPQNELPIVKALQKENRQNVAENKKEQKQSPKEIVREKKEKKKGKGKSSTSIGDAGKIPKLALLLKDLRAYRKQEREKQEKEKREEIESKIDFQIDSPTCPESAYNGKIYVQHKGGFCAMGRDEVLKSMSPTSRGDENDAAMNDSTANTAASFQKYWTRAITSFHGILAGFALCHAATVTAIMMRSDYQPSRFVDVYSGLSLKIHYVFYALTTLCIVSCFDRIDVGHANRGHWRTLRKVPSAWIILGCYLVSFGLSLANQKIEARFEAPPVKNDTEESFWERSEVEASLFFWYHSVWARDVLVLFAWFIVCMTQFQDFLYVHLSNTVKYIETKN